MIMKSQKKNKRSLIETKGNHSHHHSVALNSTQFNTIISSSTGSTGELRIATSRVPSSQSKLR